MIAALVPAAGKSVRMGRPKLILQVDGVSIISHVIAALRNGGAERLVVVSPPRDAPGALELIAEAERAGAEVATLAGPTDDMRATVQFGLEQLARGTTPEGVLLAPGDTAGISASVVAHVIAQFRENRSSIVVPTYRGRGGHPVLIPWSLAEQIPGLPAGAGVNALMKDRPESVLKLEVDDAGTVVDLDTPEDYRQWVRQGKERPSSETPRAPETPS